MIQTRRSRLYEYVFVHTEFIIYNTSIIIKNNMNANFPLFFEL